MRPTAILSLLLFGAAASLAAATKTTHTTTATHAKAAAPAVAHGLTAADLKWVTRPEMAGAMMAVAYGNPETGPFGAFEKWPAGAKQPLHHHTANVRGVGLSGTLVITMEDGKVLELGPGSFASIPSKAKHTTECKPGAECSFFVEMTGKADTVPAEVAKK